MIDAPLDFDNDIPNSTPAELREPATTWDIREHSHYQRTLESLETRYAEGVFREGGVVRMALEGSDTVVLCITIAQLAEVQAHNRKQRGW